MKKLFKHLLLLSFALIVACNTDLVDHPTPPIIPDPEPETTEMYEVIGDNLYYTELQLGVSKTFYVTPKDLDKDSKAEGIVWYVNKEKATTGVSYTFAPTVAGKYTIEYKIIEKNSTTGKEQSKSFNVVAYDMPGVLMLEESLPDTQEFYHGVSQHIFGTKEVTRYIKGDFKSFGETSNHMQSWGNHIYSLSWAIGKGVALSQFTAGDAPKFVKSVAKFDAAVKAFAGIDENRAVITTTVANLIDLKTLEVKAVLKGSEGARSVFVTDGYLFVITKAGALAYKIDNLSAETEPKVLGAATIGFIQSKDGSVFAFNTIKDPLDANAVGSTEILRININDLSVKVSAMPEGFVVNSSAVPWKQYAMAASAKENVIFLMNDNGWGTGKEVFKYNADTDVLTKEFVKITGGEWDNFLYGTSVIYNAQKDELVCAVLKGYGVDYSNSILYTFNASTGAQTSELKFSTLGEGAKDMWSNGMLAPIKKY